MYIKNICEFKNKIEVEKHYPGRYGAPGVKRAERINKTPEEMAKQNLWRKVRDLRRKIEFNFEANDWHAILTCKKNERPDKEGAVKIIRKFRDQLRDKYKTEGWELKYIITTEYGKRGAVHFHMIVNNLQNERTSTSKLIKSIWKTGRVFFIPLEEDGDYKTLAEYIVKESVERIKEGKSAEKLSYMPSRNLVQPPVKKEEKKGNRWLQEPRVPKGYYLDKDSLVNGFNKFTGLPYQYYTLKKILIRERKRKSG